MSVAPARIAINSVAVSAFTPASGQQQEANNASYALAPYPLQNPPQLIAVDCVLKTVNGTATITFPNLPIRGTGNPLSTTQNQPQTLTIDTGDTLMFEVGIQGAPGTVTISGIIIDNKNVPHNAPFIGGGTYKTFQAKITTTSSLNLTVWGKLYLQRGAGS